MAFWLHSLFEITEAKKKDLIEKYITINEGTGSLRTWYEMASEKIALVTSFSLTTAHVASGPVPCQGPKK